MKPTFAPAYALLAIAATLGDAEAQIAEVGEPPRIGCFRGRPAPACRSFWIVEMQGETPVAQTTRTVVVGPGQSYEIRTFEERLEWNVGHMVNISPPYAVGGVLTIGAGADPWLTGFKLRGRRWFNDNVSLELEGGLLRAETYPPASFGITADARLNIRDQGSFYLRWDGLALPRESPPGSGILDPGGFQQSLSVGVGLGSVPALVGTGALGIAMLIFLAAWVASGGPS